MTFYDSRLMRRSRRATPIYVAYPEAAKNNFSQWHQLETMFISAKTYYREKLLPLLA